MSLLGAGGSAELGKVASGLATQGLWLGDRKWNVSQSAKTEADFLKEEQLGKLEKEKDEEEDHAKRKDRIRRFRLDLGERRASRLPCFSLGFDDDRRGVSGSRDVGLTIFITFMSGSKSFSSFTNYFFDCNRLPDLSLAFDAAERNGKIGPNPDPEK